MISDIEVNYEVIEGRKYNGTDMGNPGLDKLGADIDKDTSPRKLISDFIVKLI